MHLSNNDAGFSFVSFCSSIFPIRNNLFQFLHLSEQYRIQDQFRAKRARGVTIRPQVKHAFGSSFAWSSSSIPLLDKDDTDEELDSCLLTSRFGAIKLPYLVEFNIKPSIHHVGKFVVGKKEEF